MDNKEDVTRIGVFLCQCGGNISDKVDIEKIETILMEDEKIQVVTHYENLCSIEGGKIIKEKIITENLDRVVIAACSSVTHGDTFKQYVKPLNPYLFEMPNIREQCSWVENDPDKATNKALSLIRSGVESVQYSEPLDSILGKVRHSALVVGAGISGITTALSLAKQGIKTTLVEEKPTIGGSMVQVGKVFSPAKLTEDCAMCLLNPLVNEAVENKNITILTNTVVESSKKRSGNFNVILKKHAVYVDEDKCTSCGRCSEVCPISAPDMWNEGLIQRKAIYKPFPQAVPNTYTIDEEHCIKCGKCEETCQTNAINLNAYRDMISLNVGSIVIATGHKRFDTKKRPEYGHEKYEDVITQMELARIMGVNGPTYGKLLTPSTGKIPKRIVMVQCVGSRDDKPYGHKYCSKICCMVAIKSANLIKQHYPNTEVIICYTDIRTPGMYEKYYKYGQTQGIKLIRGRPGEITKKDGHLIVRVEDTLTSERKEIETNMVVLSAAIEPSSGTVRLAKTLGVSLTEDKFIKEKHPKIKPVTTDIQGIFVCGTAQGPKDITESVIQANAVSSKIAERLNGGLEVEPFIANTNQKKCSMCLICVEQCKYNAINKEHNTIYVDPLSCTGCGACMISCPEQAISIRGQSDEKLEAKIEGILKDKKPDEKIIIAFLDDIGNISADNIGVNRISCPSSIRIIHVPYINRVKYQHVKHALTHGADGIFLGEYPDTPTHNQIRENFKNMKKQLKEDNINPDRLIIHRTFIPYFRGLSKQFEQFDEQIKQEIK
ncbi:MAG: FAD-dependent oxidoreductase [Methanobacteriaceae archaeon]|nr:FAD-dependent oxidoreductase [Methanobacteriaceae archaeon]